MRRVLGAIALAMALLVGPATPASAGVCTLNVFCGRVSNDLGSKASIRTSNNWPPSAGSIQWVRPGSRSTWKDTDGFWIPAGYRGWSRSWGVYGPGWHKINNLQSVALYVYIP